MANTDSALLLFKMEATAGVDSLPTPAANAFNVSSPEFDPDIQRLERDNARQSLSPQPSRVGRITSSVKFGHEVVGSGADDASIEPIVAPFLRACGFAQTQYSTAGFIQGWSRSGNTGRGTLAAGAGDAYTGDAIRYATVEITTAGGDGVAQATVSAPEFLGPDGATVAAFTSAGQSVGGAMDGPEGSKVDLTLTVDAAVGDKWVAQIAPPGYLYSLISTDFETATSYLYYDGLLHKAPNCRGTVSLSATAGQLAKLDFTFMGDWQDPIDVALPTDAVYSELIAPQVELADIRVDNQITACPATFGFDLGNNVVIKECANAAQGYSGANINDRKPVVTFDPAFGPEGNYAYWQKLKTSDEIDFSFTVGTERGNSLHVLSHIQLASLGYGDRSKTRIYSVEGEAVSRAGNDELSIYIF